ncbi:hypothetical protein RND81_04G165000 [Saponaria officinalis]|uniref:Uncharacterized protein n=1 Tax=Saponaria officinalis TaxID=3572 RepID=A0AAW1LMG6_SAPOF
MYDDNQFCVENVSHGDVIKKEINVDDRKYSINRGWPDWLPQDWCIHQNICDLGTSSNVYYSNPEGKAFYTKEEVFEHIANHPSHNTINTQIGLFKPIKVKRKLRRNKLSIKDNPPSQLNPTPKWPEWLPQDWCIKRSYEDPCNMYYYSPEWKKFRCKDEVLNHVAQSMKPKPEFESKSELEPKQIRRKRKNSNANKDDKAFVGAKRRRKRKNNVTS